MTKIYTKTGDSGETSDLSGGRVWKDCLSMQAVGELDELNAALGLVAAEILAQRTRGILGKGGSFDELLAKQIHDIQCDLFRLGAEAAAVQSAVEMKLNLIGAEEIIALEKQIDAWWAQMPELKNFILPGGSKVGAQLHFARAVCRRAERTLVALGKQYQLRPGLYQYLNRLSDWLFSTARFANFVAGVKEEVVR